MNNKGWLQAIKINPKDQVLRMVYADYLEEQGEYIESERQRTIANNLHHVVRMPEPYWYSVYEEYTIWKDIQVISEIWDLIELPPDELYNSGKSAKTELEWVDAVALAYAKMY